MKEDYVSFEIAKLLKEKGFHELCHCNYHCYGFFYQHKEKDYNGKNYEKLNSEWYSAPTLQMAMKWLREVHKLAINIEFQIDSPTWKWRVCHIEPSEDKHTNFQHYNTYEEAVEVSIKYCLENLI